MTPGTGLHPRPPAAEHLVPYFPRIRPESHEPLLFAPREGETIREIHARARHFLRLLIEHIDRHHPDVQTIFLVSHAATVIALGRALSDDRDKDVPAGTCSLSHYRRISPKALPEDRDLLGDWECILNGSTAHLQGGENVSRTSLTACKRVT